MRNFAQKEQKLRTLCHPSQRSLVKRRPLARDLIGPNLAQYLMLGAADLKKTTVQDGQRRCHRSLTQAHI